MFSTVVLPLSHANVIPERGFSINKHLLSIHRNSINEETVVGLRLVKDHLFKVGGPTKVKTMPKLLVYVKNSFQRYNADLEGKVSIGRELEKKNPREKQRLRKINRKVRIYLKLKMI